MLAVARATRVTSVYTRSGARERQGRRGSRAGPAPGGAAGWGGAELELSVELSQARILPAYVRPSSGSGAERRGLCG